MPLVDVLVIGAGQAGLSAAYHLQHRWASLKMATVNGIYELPGYPVAAANPESRSRDVLPAYFAEYEQRFELDVQRPVRVLSVQRGTGEFDTRLRVETEGETGRLATSSTPPAPGPDRIGRTTRGERRSGGVTSTCTTASRLKSSPGSVPSSWSRGSPPRRCSRRSRW